MKKNNGKSEEMLSFYGFDMQNKELANASNGDYAKIRDHHMAEKNDK